ncbi:hypothetical protein GCM10010123_29390 [Pilimelia anulata]|uniref:Septum formation-related domain-containing protein n=1 Tax=Pilimelia anulata TaxID=53371 RepID=A0A8J3B6K8_9ACTN|nr:septum formation family protein [Pilimelia anulata]GGJ97479.1 hypothetical protein GCM10010123_29390 [Pilimelia anulata]
MRVGRALRAALVPALLGALAACGTGRPPGIDGVLADEWPDLPELTTFTPRDETCHAAFAESGPRAAYEPVDCDKPHKTETIHVGGFTGTAAEAKSPPTTSSAAYRGAYATCDKEATKFLGKDFRYGRLWLGVTVPSSPGWAGGARWYRCELGEVANVEDFGDLINRSGTLADGLATASPLDLGCYRVTASAAGAITKMTPVACTGRHNSEFVGVFTAPAALAYPTTGPDWERMHTRCRAVVATYVKVPNDANLRYRTGTVAVPNTEEDWEAGNRGVRCYLYVNTGKFTESLKGAGVKGLPER